jgi:hypothetical protein
MVDVFGPASPLIDLKAFTAQAQSRISDYLPDAGGSARFQAMTDQQRSWMLNRLECVAGCSRNLALASCSPQAAVPTSGRPPTPSLQLRNESSS